MRDRTELPDLTDPLTDEHAGLVADYLRTKGIRLPNTFVSDLRAAGTNLVYFDAIELHSLFRIAFGVASQHLSSSDMTRQKRIETLTAELANLLAEESEQEIAVKGSERDTKYWEISIETSDVIDAVDALRRRAVELQERHAMAATWPLIPGSNRADRMRFSYWLALLAFWSFALGREIRGSVDPETELPSGPLVRFIEIMSGDMKTTPSMIRKFYREHKEKALALECFFDCSARSLDR